MNKKGGKDKKISVTNQKAGKPTNVKVKESRLKRDKTEILDVVEVNKINDEITKMTDENIRLSNQLNIKKIENDHLNNDIKKYKNVINFLMVIVILITLLLFIFFINTKNNPVIKEVQKDIKVADDNYVFLGDSITALYDLDKFYKDMPVIKSGVSGYTTQDILDRMNDLVYKYNPSDVFLLIGTNDIGFELDEKILLDNITTIIKNIKKNRPLTEIYVESIYPINNTNDNKISHEMVGIRTNDYIIEANKKIKKICKDEGVVYIDLYDDLVDKNGQLKLEYTVEGLHISDKGYDVITKTLKSYLNK